MTLSNINRLTTKEVKMLNEIKDDVMLLCTDLFDGMPDDFPDRVRLIRRSVIESNQWIEKTAHLQLKILNCLWDALLPGKSFEDVRWRVNQVDGWIDDAIRIDTGERRKGIPKPIKKDTFREDGTDNWIEEHLDDSDTEFVTSKELYIMYQEGITKETPDIEVLNTNSFGQRLSQAGFSRATKKIDGKAEKVWKVRVIE